MPRSVTTQARANHKAARMPTPMLHELLDALGDDALPTPDLKARLRGRTLRALRRPAGPGPVRAPFAPDHRGGEG